MLHLHYHFDNILAFIYNHLCRKHQFGFAYTCCGGNCFATDHLKMAFVGILAEVFCFHYK